MPCRKKILDPRGPFLQKWNKIFAISCLFAVSIDPLFFYIPVVDKKKNSLGWDKKLEFAACVLRFSTDMFYILHIIFQFQTGFIAPSSRVFGRGVVVEDPLAIARKYLRSYFLIDILAILPLPQVLILGIIPKLRGSEALITILLRLVILLQYVPRFIRIYPLYKEVTKTSGIINETSWAGAAISIFGYILAGHIFGALLYLLRVERVGKCWQPACRGMPGCHSPNLLCGDYSREGGNAFRDKIFSPDDRSPFNHGIYHTGVLLSRDFSERLFYCFWLGLKSLSSLGQNLAKTTYMWEMAFVAFGLVLFSLVIGNMQAFMQSHIVGLDETYRIKRRDIEEWMSHRVLPDKLKKRIRRYEQYKWQETRGVDEDNFLRNLPKDLRLDIKRHMCLNLLMRVPMFGKMDKRLLDAMCVRLKTVLYTKQGYIVREGEPVDEMIFIMRGKLLSVTTNGGRTGFFNSDYLKDGDFYGEELLTWALNPCRRPSSNLPKSTRTVKALTEVEGFALVSDDLKLVASQFRILHSKQLRQTFRFYSQHWRTWAVCFIQAVWHQYSKRKLEDSLSENENGLQEPMVEGSEIHTSLGATIYASRSATNVLHSVQHNGLRRGGLLERLPSMLPQKPAEPDFFH